MTRIYTRTGDTGETDLYGGDRASKACPRLEACGALDELNCAIGILRLHASPEANPPLERIQNDLFVLGSHLAATPGRLASLKDRLHQGLWPIPDIEADIDRLMALAPSLTTFVLPGGSPGAAHAHWVRSLCRRAERRVVSLNAESPLEPELLIYVNRLSDWFFALARAENARLGQPDTLWKS